MKRSKMLFVGLAMTAALAAGSCGDDNGGGGDTDPNTVCAECAAGQAREDCENDLLICSTFTDPGARQACIDGAAC
jgi:hypothetical protein